MAEKFFFSALFHFDGSAVRTYVQMFTSLMAIKVYRKNRYAFALEARTRKKNKKKLIDMVLQYI